MEKHISAREVVADIRGGMNAGGLRAKYGLTEKSLVKLLEKVKSMGVVPLSQLTKLNPSRPEDGASHLEQTSGNQSSDAAVKPLAANAFKCPTCGFTQQTTVSDCPRCALLLKRHPTAACPRQNVRESGLPFPDGLPDRFEEIQREVREKEENELEAMRRQKSWFDGWGPFLVMLVLVILAFTVTPWLWVPLFIFSVLYLYYTVFIYMDLRYVSGMMSIREIIMTDLASSFLGDLISATDRQK